MRHVLAGLHPSRWGKVYWTVNALEVAFDLMMNSKNEAIRARMLKFFAAGAKVSPVAIHVDARQVKPPTVYIYKRPASLGGSGDEAVKP